MNTLPVYAYDPASGAYLGETVAWPDPLTAGEYLIPAGATAVAPPAAGAHQVAQWVNGAWTLVADYRGWAGYKADGTAVEISTIGVSPDAAWTTSPPPPTVAQAQATQEVTVKNACATAIAAGFTSSALGSACSYGSQTADQANIATAAVAGGTLWCANGTSAWSFAAHTAAQAQQVRADLWTHIQAQQATYAKLLGEISAATTVAAVEAVVWP